MKTKKPDNHGDATVETEPMTDDDLKLAIAEERAHDDGMEGRLDQLTKAIALYDTTGSENRGQGFDKVKAYADKYGEPAYTVIVEKLAVNAVYPVQNWILNRSEEWMNQRVILALINMMPRDWDVSEHLGVVLAMNWEIAKEAIEDKIKKLDVELNRIKKPFVELRESGAYIKSHQDIIERERQEINQALISVGGKGNIEAIGTALGLASMTDKESSEQPEIFATLFTAVHNEHLKERVFWGLQTAFWLVKKIEEQSSVLGEPTLSPVLAYGLKIQKGYKAKRSELNTLAKGLFGEFIVDERGKETSGHRRIEHKTHKNSAQETEIPTILKYCDKFRAGKERDNFEILKSWGLPTPKVIGVSENGIQVEDLTEGGAKILVMDEDGSFQKILGALSNSEDLKKDMAEFAVILKAHGVDMDKLDRVLGLVIDKDKTGKLYFVDVDHIHLEKGRKKGK